MTEISDKKACLIAKKYVWEEYFTVNRTSYYWEEGSDEDIGGAQPCSGFFPPDDRYYKTFLISAVRITGAKVTKRYESGEIDVSVYCTTTQCEGSSEDNESEDEEDEFYEEEREVFCYLELDEEEGSWCVTEIEE